MSSPIEQAIRQICEEKGLSYEAVLQTIESALAAAYRKDFVEKDHTFNVEVEFDPATGMSQVFDVKTVVEDMDSAELEAAEQRRKERMEEFARTMEEARAKGDDISGISLDLEDTGPRFNPKTEIMLTPARLVKPDAEIGDVIHTELPQPGEYGRMAAMTAKQVIMQKLREAEREIIFNEFKEHEGQILNGTIQRREGRVVLVDLGRTAGVMRPEDQVPTERYNPGDRVKVYVRQVSLTTRGPEILVSRASEDFVRRLFEMEIPEVAEGTVVLKGIAREAGSRSKIAVHATEDAIDPIGACIGQRGTRIQTVISALGGEKIDLIEWSENPADFIKHALSPAKVETVALEEADRAAKVVVPNDQLSLAIGKGGQNVRLAARLTGWKINVAGSEPEVAAPEAPEVVEAVETPASEPEAPAQEAPAAETPVPTPEV